MGQTTLRVESEINGGKQILYLSEIDESYMSLAGEHCMYSQSQTGSEICLCRDGYGMPIEHVQMFVL